MNFAKLTIKAFLLVLALGMGAARGADTGKPMSVAVSVYSKAPSFIGRWINDLRQHLAVLDGRVELVIYDSTSRHDYQHMHFEIIAVKQHDAVIVVANDMFASNRLMELLAGTGIPVVASCAQTRAGDLLDAFIGPDDFQAGYLTAVAVAEKLSGQGNVLVLRGPPEQGATQFRDSGITKALAEYPEISKVRSETANWSAGEAMQVVRKLLNRGLPIDGIIAQNDDMALGAIQAFKVNGMALVPIASIDGMGEAEKAVRTGELLQTLRQDTVLQAQGALDLVLRNLMGPEYLPESAAWNGTLLQQWNNGSSSRFTVPWETISARTMELSSTHP